MDCNNKNKDKLLATIQEDVVKLRREVQFLTESVSSMWKEIHELQMCHARQLLQMSKEIADLVEEELELRGVK